MKNITKFAGMAISLALPASIALSDDFKTNDGKNYTNVTVIRVEPDGIALKSKTGIVKVYFTELPAEVQVRFHYNRASAAQFTAAQQQELEAEQQKLEAERQKAIAERQAQARARQEQAQRQADREAEYFETHQRPVSSMTSVGGGG